MSLGSVSSTMIELSFDDTEDTLFFFFITYISKLCIRSMLINLCNEKNYQSIFPPIELCGDNAAMIAMVGLEKFKLKQFSKLDHPAKPRWPLDEKAPFLKGAGVKLS